MSDEISHRLKEGERREGALTVVWKTEKMSVKLREGMYETVFALTVTSGSET